MYYHMTHAFCLVSIFNAHAQYFVLQDSGTPEEHATHVWQNYVKRSKAKHIDIVAHSYGGVVAVSLVSLCNLSFFSLYH